MAVPVKPDNGEAERVMAAAWPEFGGNHQPAEFWETFSLAVQFTLKELSSHDETAKKTETRSATVEQLRAVCPRCREHPVDLVLLGTDAEGHICGNCWANDRYDSAIKAGATDGQT